MKKLINIIIIGFAITLVNTSCTGNFEEINTNPNSPESVSNAPQLLLTTSQQRVASRMLNQAWGEGNLNAQYAAKIVFTEYDQYNWGSQSGIWNDFYTSAREAQTLEENASEGYAIVSKVLRAWIFQQLTDLYGDIPYSEALKAKSDKNYSPAYDSQQDIYAALIQELKDANDVLSNDIFPIEGDVINNSDYDKWQKLTNGLLLRLYMRMSEVDPTTAQNGIVEIVNNPAKYPLMTSNADNSELVYGTTGTDAAPGTEESGRRVGSFDEYRMSETLEGVLKDLSDPRMERWFRPTANSVDAGSPEYSGMLNGLSDGIAYSYKGGSAFLSRFGESFFEEPNTITSVIMSYTEQEFILAEAGQRGWIANGDVHYANGVQAAFEFWDVTMPADYLTRTNVQWDGTLTPIIKQKWLSLLMVGFEAFSDYRRTGLPAEITPGPDAVYNYVPYRFEYPTEEQALNATNYSAAVAAQGDDKITTKIWWIN